MSGVVELVQGDLFEGPCDLIVLPCSTGAAVTDFVAERLDQFRIPYYRGNRMPLGGVTFMPFEGGERIASYVAYAASVKSLSSNKGAIEEIGEKLGDFAANTPSIQMISAPLLGAGAGGLSPQVSLASLKNGFLRRAPDRAVLRVSVINGDVFESLKRIFNMEEVSQARAAAYRERRQAEQLRADMRLLQNDIPISQNIPTRVFISYTKTSNEHAMWVKGLAIFLRENGIDARLDVWHLRLGMDVAQWMCNELELAERVLVICNKEYANRANGRQGGVGWEVRLVQGDLLARGAENIDRYIPIICEEVTSSSLPAFLMSTYGIVWPPQGQNDSKAREELVRTIFRVNEEAPPIGQPPRYVIKN